MTNHLVKKIKNTVNKSFVHRTITIQIIKYFDLDSDENTHTRSGMQLRPCIEESL